MLLQKKDRSTSYLHDRLNVEDANFKYFVNSNGVLCRKYVRDHSESDIHEP